MHRQLHTIAPTLRLNMNMDYDFSFFLAIATIGYRYYLGRLFVNAQIAGPLFDEENEPLLVEYARSFFPVVLIVLVAALIYSRAFSHSFRINDADITDRRFYSG